MAIPVCKRSIQGGPKSKASSLLLHNTTRPYGKLMKRNYHVAKLFKYKLLLFEHYTTFATVGLSLLNSPCGVVRTNKAFSEVIYNI